MPGMTKRVERLVYQAEEFVINGQSKQKVVTKMASYGYDAARWAEGQTLLDKLKEKVRVNEAAFATQLGKTDVFNTAFDKAWDQSQSLGLLCAELFKGRIKSLSLLGLHKKRDERTGESRIARPRTRNVVNFMGWARNLYAVAQENEEIAATLAGFGYPAGRLSAEAADVEAMVRANGEQESAKATMYQSTIDRDEAAKRLKTWLRRAKTVAKLALEGNRELLELVGLRGRRR